jgi:hypothetical protein
MKYLRRSFETGVSGSELAFSRLGKADPSATTTVDVDKDRSDTFWLWD